MIKLRYTPAGQRDGHLGARRQGHHVRLGRHRAQAGRRGPRPDEERHVGRRRHLRGDARRSRDAGCRRAVTGWLMCTDNMPSGTAMALGDVITMRGGTTVEVINTDAEGRLVMADALVLATEDGVDAIVDIATLTGACMRALGTQVAGVIGNDAALVDQVRGGGRRDRRTRVAAAARPALPRASSTPTVADLRTWAAPTPARSRPRCSSPSSSATRPWAHIDIAGTAQSTGDARLADRGCSGFGARLLLQFALDFERRTTMTRSDRALGSDDQERRSASGCSTGSRRSATRSRTRRSCSCT